MPRKPKLIVNPTDHRHFFSPKIASLLGHMTIHWSYLEFHVQSLLWELSETEEIGDILTRKLGVERWLDDISLIARYRFKDDAILEELATVVTNIHDAQRRRNDFVHHLYAATSRPGTVAQAFKKVGGKKLKRAFKVSTRIIRARELDKLITDIHSANLGIVNWTHHHLRRIGAAERLLPSLRQLIPATSAMDSNTRQTRSGPLSQDAS